MRFSGSSGPYQQRNVTYYASGMPYLMHDPMEECLRITFSPLSDNNSLIQSKVRTGESGPPVKWCDGRLLSCYVRWLPSVEILLQHCSILLVAGETYGVD